MRIRTTENTHYFTEVLFKSIGAIEIGGLTMDEDRNFTAVIEAVEFGEKEKEDLKMAFEKEKIQKEFLFSQAIGVPFYIISYKKNVYKIYEIRREENLVGKLINKLDSDEQFAEWWANIKRTEQPHPLNNGARPRANQTRFDYVIEATGQSWGGNVDGVIIRDNKILAIIDNISISFTDLEDFRADPARFFHQRGPVYNTWFSTVKLANELNVPHILLTLNKNDPNEEICGITSIDNLNHDGIYYINNITPPENVFREKQNIINEIDKKIGECKVPTYV